jgi:hypothetical protein
MLPIISLSFLHMLVKFEEEEKNKIVDGKIEYDVEKLSKEIGKQEAEIDKEKYTPTQEDLNRLEEELKKINEKKFGSLIEELPEQQQEITNKTSEEVNETTPQPEVKEMIMDFPPQIKRLNYLRSHG